MSPMIALVIAGATSVIGSSSRNLRSQSSPRWSAQPTARSTVELRSSRRPDPRDSNPQARRSSQMTIKMTMMATTIPGMTKVAASIPVSFGQGACH